MHQHHSIDKFSYKTGARDILVSHKVSGRYKKGKFYMHQILPTDNYRMTLHQIEIMGMKSGKTIGSHEDTTTQNLPSAHRQYSNQQTQKLNSWHIKGVVSYS